MRVVPFILLASAGLGLTKPLVHNAATNEVRPKLTVRMASPDQSCTGGNQSLCTTTLQDCLASKNIPVYFANSAGFSELAEPYNLRLVYTPAVIVVPTDAGQVADAVVCAAENNVKVQAKSGGHSYASFSSGGKDGSMVIDLQAFQDIDVNPEENYQAKVGAGVRLGDLALSIYGQSQRALPHGTCPGVGVGGHATHGGYGYTSRTWGLTLDTFIGADVVLANGTFIHATVDEYPDVFYALRGAADSFGIVVFFYFQTKPAPSSVVNWSYSIPGMYVSAVTSAAVFKNIQDFALNPFVVDRKLAFGVYLDGSSFSISGTYLGDTAHFTDIIAPVLLKGLPTPSASSVTTNSWIDSLTKLAAPQPLQQPTTGYDLHDDFFAKSLVVPSTSALTTAALESYFTYIIENGVNPPSPWFSIINLYGGPDSQINVPSPSSSAYSDRNALWVLQHYSYTPNTGSPFPPADFGFVGGLNTALTSAMPDTTFSGYLNYVDPSLSAAEAHSAYYDAPTYAKLLRIKNEIDPGDVFWNPQAIGN